MKNNLSQVKKDGLPVVSEDKQIQRNSMRLYLYLVSISKFCGQNKPREFMQSDFSVNKIHELLGMHATTIKKYWRILEDNGLIQFQGRGFDPFSEEFDPNLSEQAKWDKYFIKRKNNKASFYKIPKGQQYRIIPRETVDKIQNEFLVDELELKLYLLLANMQEHFCYLKPPERLFTLQDLRELLQITKKVENNKKLINALFWLEKLNLIKYELLSEKTNLGTKRYVFNLIAVNYYTDGGQISQILSSNNDTKMSQEIKDSIINNQIVYFED